MILIDFSQVVISVAVDYFRTTTEQVSLDLLRHISLNNILMYKKKFSETENSNIALCFDGHNYWRKKLFPYYKQNRVKKHEEDKFDWDTFFKSFNQIKKEFISELPYRCIEVESCEADDVIAFLCEILCSSQKKIIIVSSDKDLLQIQENICNKVAQWSPFHKKFITPEQREYSLFEHIVRGDNGDGIPNILSDDDVIISEGKRQKPITSQKIKSWDNEGSIRNPERFCDTEKMLERFNRNHALIDLRMIPIEMKNKIREAYDETDSFVTGFAARKKSVYSYLVKNQLVKILNSGYI